MTHHVALLVGLLTTTFATAAAPGALELSSRDIKPDGTIGSAQVLNGFGCAGGNVSPALEWKHAPAGTKSFALTAYDPDAPTGSGWWHWVVVNIPATAASLPAGAGATEGSSTLPAGSLQVRTDFGVPGYGGPCPPAGDKPHRYVFTLHALKAEKLELPPTATAALAGFMIRANELDRAVLVGTYGR
jgi:Raf kinase inhibitor-like YbhB/YbcL family protein